jgi:hypothetical protein
MLNGKVAVAITSWALDDKMSQYVPDIAEVYGSSEAGPDYEPDKKELGLRMLLCAVAHCTDATHEVDDILLNFHGQLHQAVAYDAEGRKVYMTVRSCDSGDFLSGANSYIGMYFLSLTPTRKKSSGADYGAWVCAVSPLGPAYKAGIRKGDVVTRMGETELTTPEAADSVLSPMGFGTEPVDIAVVRAGKKRHFKVTPIVDPINKEFPKTSDQIWKQLEKALTKGKGKTTYGKAVYCSYERVPKNFKPVRIEFLARDR